MGEFLDWSDGPPAICATNGNGIGDDNFELDPASNAPYLWSAEGSLLGRLPTDLESLSGATKALECPYPGEGSPTPTCTGETTASGDLTHIIFSSRSLSFAEIKRTHQPGLTEAPGSAYGNDALQAKTNVDFRASRGRQPRLASRLK